MSKPLSPRALKVLDGRLRSARAMLYGPINGIEEPYRTRQLTHALDRLDKAIRTLERTK